MSVAASTVRDIINSAGFKELVRKRIVVSTVLTVLMLIVYFGFILSIAFYREILSYQIGEHLPLGLPIGIGLIVFAWLLTGYYVRWANHSYDQKARELRNQLLQQ
jgi:uncharacterized membrane protein (DUF485 family)